jgi:hypothetical protein
VVISYHAFIHIISKVCEEEKVTMKNGAIRQEWKIGRKENNDV